MAMPAQQEPDLSLEVQETVRANIAERSKSVSEVREKIEKDRQGPTTNDKAEVDDSPLGPVADDQATETVKGIIATLKEFYGDLSADKLSQLVRDIVHSNNLLRGADTELRAALGRLVPKDIGDWKADSIEGHLAVMQRNARSLNKKVVALMKNPKFQVVTITTSAGTLVLGTVGGVAGTGLGTVVGGTIGVVPALFTFGLSIPTGAVVGGGLGCAAGVTAGAGAGAIGGAGTGLVGYAHRVELKSGAITIYGKVRGTTDKVMVRLSDTTCAVKCYAVETADSAKCCALAKATQTREKARALVTYTWDKAGTVAVRTKTKAAELGSKAATGMKTPTFKATAASAAGGTVVLGATGGALGTVAGVIVGGAMGVVPALFTFGLSIPVGAALGGASGCAVGTGVGASAGAVVGGGVGYGGYTYREELGSKGKELKARVKEAWAVPCAMAHSGMSRAHNSWSNLVGGTGGSE